MWLIEPQLNIKESKSGIDNLNLLMQQDNIFVMDNHLAAGWCWLHILKQDVSYNFYHIDQHFDLCDNAPREIIEPINHLPITLSDYCRLSYSSHLTTLKAFTWDNYIKQVQYFYSHWFQVCHFACHEYCNDSRCDNPLNIAMNIDFFALYDSISCQINSSEQKWILNLDIDYFFKEELQISTDNYIEKVAVDIKKAMPNIACLTIALSPECCGGWNNAIRVYNIIASILNLEKLNI